MRIRQGPVSQGGRWRTCSKLGLTVTVRLPGAGNHHRMTRRKVRKRGLLGLVALFLLIQLVPYGHSHANPPVTKAVRWSSPATGKLFAQACQDCHSNLSSWRWYDN